MPLGEPVGPSQSQWKISVDSVARVADYPVTFTATVSTDNIDDPAVQGVVQQMVDLLNASPDFVLRSAARTSTYAEQMTPTA
ncbi:hypothetical protein [Streptomyces cupreus]|uniref:Uncharacterized protein n=1 Tax=Streptomyces cupreus TaxID=2759956 RepID=A0A7X1M9Q6_9ACTN|nr:hypothetical protein [Streptomyces cupreus]MBC2903534.1 hypothetical protein [Streptomyces cupreus]